MRCTYPCETSSYCYRNCWETRRSRPLFDDYASLASYKQCHNCEKIMVHCDECVTLDLTPEMSKWAPSLNPLTEKMIEKMMLLGTQAYRDPSFYPLYK